ncbi:MULTISPECIES: DUF4344 domain-containing metallopeptidase [unclassified Shewanella]|uniref:DUF4344 domain-containing metallopeptidase n=1 Tax=unclassified Shewanella TaxID=196818 RepID=UPI001BBD9EA1|nr:MULTISPECIES: DUF4344 domain-containing metallopeptidase [unclassified Shewanella]GIU14136.1 hypothetical protein TUM4444_23470 [Shewanella sp. MBTL60-112-B1]GIU29873.1 hypothetical protein TUM4445_12610 [Shewanella sp. MBTL60-112-B2]
MTKWLAMALLLSFSCQSPAAVVSQFITAETRQELRAYRLIKAIEPQLQQVYLALPMQHKLTLVYGAQDGPLFDPELMQIQIPYHFVTEVLNRFTKDEYQQTGVTPKQATQDALLHTLGHEYGHAYIYANQVIVLGREEDAVDTLATLLLIHAFKDGAEIALSAADLFALEDEDIDELVEGDFSDEHSLDAQRYHATVCLIYGSDPDKYAALLSTSAQKEDRAAMCEQEYARQSDNWERLKSRYLAK